MDEETKRVRAAAEGLGRRGRGAAFPASIRRLVGDHGLMARSAGASWQQISERVGVAVESAGRFAQASEMGSRSAVVPVTVLAGGCVSARADGASARPAALVLVSPGGYRLEGPDESLAVRVLAALS